MEPSGETRATAWDYVGEGKGDYDMINRFEFVGDGKGNFHFSQGHNWRFKPVCKAAAATTAVLAVSLTAAMFGAHGLDLPSTTSSPLRHPGGDVRGDDPVSKAIRCEMPGRMTLLQEKICCEQLEVRCPTPGRTPGAPPSVPIKVECSAGFAHWQRGWSAMKKAYCCRREGKGCPPVPAGLAQPVPKPPAAPAQQASPALSPALDPAAPQPAGMPAPPPAATPGPKPAPPVGLPSAAAPGAPPTPATATPMLYDCNAGFDQWQARWSQGKREWCCQHARRGCPPGF